MIPRSLTVRNPVVTLSSRTAAWRRLRKLLPGTSRRLLNQAVATTVVASVATAAIPIIIGVVVDAVFDDGRLVGLNDAIVPLSLLLACYLLINIMDVVRHQKVHTVTTSFEATARRSIYGHALRFPLSRFHEGTDGAIYGRANRSVEGAVDLLKLGASDLLPAVLVAVLAVVAATVHAGLLGLLMSLVIPTGFGLVSWQITSQRGIRRSVKQSKERIDAWVTSCLSMVKVIRTSGTERYFDDQVGDEVDGLRAVELRHHVAMSLFDCMKAANEMIWLIATILFAVEFRLATSPGELASLILLYAALTKPLRDLHRVIDEISDAAMHARDLLDDLDSPVDPSFTLTRATPDSSLSLSLSTSRDVEDGAIEFRRVTFAYPGGGCAPVLRGIDLTVEPGSRVGLVGSSGSGKSTILDLVDGLHHDYDGLITLSGRDLRTTSRAELAGIVAYVGQRPMLFPGTIRDNLTMGRPGIADADLDDACLKASILRGIRALPGGYDFRIAQKGDNLSGGQQQRLCIARAMLGTPAVMLLDEPTSALDFASERTVQQAIDDLADVTMIVVAHRLSTLKSMDRVVVLHEGRIVEDDTFDVLASRDGAFAAMLRGEEWSAV